jgi:ferredoxin
MQALQQAQVTAGQPDEVARARAKIYYVLAEILSGPSPEMQELLLEAVTTGVEVLNSVSCRKALLNLAEMPATDLETLRRSYAYLIAPPGRQPVALSESLHYRGGLVGQVTWQVERHYQALGLVCPKGELPDHASLELTFLGHLASAEAEARADGNDQLVARLTAEQRYFLGTHAGAWLPDVGAALAAAEHRLYATVGRLLSGFLAEELTGQPRIDQAQRKLPLLPEPAACTLCGLCVGSCPLGALRIIESATETALTLNPAQCNGCSRCERSCPERVLHLSVEVTDSRFKADSAGYRIIRQSPRAECPNCGRPTVSLAELDAVLARLQPDPTMQQRLCLCVACKSWSS